MSEREAEPMDASEVCGRTCDHEPVANPTPEGREDGDEALRIATFWMDDAGDRIVLAQAIRDYGKREREAGAKSIDGRYMVREAESQVATIQEKLRQAEQWEQVALEAQRELAIAGVRGSPPHGQQGTIPLLLQRAHEAEEKLRQAEAHAKEGWEVAHATGFPHMCRDEHAEIRFKDSAADLCPVCEEVSGREMAMSRAEKAEAALEAAKDENRVLAERCRRFVEIARMAREAFRNDDTAAMKAFGSNSAAHLAAQAEREEIVNGR